ncbi:beta-1,6-N-acetylglucosaminyltransferase [Paracoccus sp. p1-h21]|uniref:DUF5927 domain-containing protein n=1 Tax=Paracoccus sp. p1-h21 TaxID=3366951 RepID=UPI0037A5C892
MTQAAPVRLGIILLCHDQLGLAAHLARIWHDGGAAVAIHVDAKVSPAEAAQLQQDLSDCADLIFTRRHSCEWGMFSLVQATQDAATALLGHFDDVTHVCLVSGSCLPLRPVPELCAYLDKHRDRDFIQSVSTEASDWIIGGLGKERFRYYFPLSFRKYRRSFDRLVDLQRALRVRRRRPDGIYPHIGSQWWCLTRRTLSAILDDPDRAAHDRFFRHSWIADESYFQTLARRHSVNIESRSLTVSKFDMQGKPYTFYDDHADMLRDSGCFIARKIWPRAVGLYLEFPAPTPDGQDPLREPDPLRIDALIDQAVTRRQLGRPGLYMQSRFPRKDCENGKTSARYGIVQGFSDLFDGFEDWLWEQVDYDVHGHILARDRVEFLGRTRVGPGALTNSAALRDMDPQGFLTSLIRSSSRTVVFQYSPRDMQDLNWFTCTDPNATMVVITGAWMVPLMGSGMPFDDIRRMAARLERAEAAQVKILRSVWVKARLTVWTLAEFLSDPLEHTNTMLELLDPHRQLYTHDLPPMRDLHGLGRFVQKLRNAGLYPRTMGNLPLDMTDEFRGM